jgi:hypothetical protein
LQLLDACGSNICKTDGVRASLLACLLQNCGAFVEQPLILAPKIRLRPFLLAARGNQQGEFELRLELNKERNG